MIKKVKYRMEEPLTVTCDPWHTTGNKEFHGSSNNTAFIQRFEHKYQRKTLPIYLGDTGYVHWSGPIPVGTRCWDIDELGRFVAVMDNIWFFQRYTDGDILVWTEVNSDYSFYWRRMSLQKLTELDKMIQ